MCVCPCAWKDPVHHEENAIILCQTVQGRHHLAIGHECLAMNPVVMLSNSFYCKNYFS